MNRSVLLIVDLQNDFLPDGPLPVKDSHKIIPLIQELIQYEFTAKIASKDWHPPNHGSFATTHQKSPGDQMMLAGLQQILWPDHCIQNTPGADFANGWDRSQIEKIFYKGVDMHVDSYSTFFDNGCRRSTGLESYLHSQQITDLYIAGLAIDYCIKHSVLDACRLGFNTFVILDACRGVNLKPHDSQKAVEEMVRAGAHIISTQYLSNQLVHP